MSRLTRRRFLALAALAGAGAAVGALASRRRALAVWLAQPAVRPAPTGELSQHAAATLLAAAQALLDARITSEAYVDFFRWRARNVPGHRAVYEGFTRAMDAAARRADAPDFARADLAVRRRVLAALSPRARWRRALEGVIARESLLYSQQVVREVMRLFARTDAWTRIGYDAWPGQPAGLAGLDAPPRGHV